MMQKSHQPSIGPHGALACIAVYDKPAPLGLPRQGNSEHAPRAGGGPRHHGEEDITLLEEEVIPAIQQCLARVDELDERLLAQQELLQRRL